MNFLTKDEIIAILEYAQQNYPDFYPLLLTTIYSEMRRGEILALTQDCVNFRFNKVLEDAGVSKIRFHDLRHTYTSLLIAKDMNIKYIQKQMGHASFEITMNTYAHIMPEVYATSEVKIEELI